MSLALIRHRRGGRTFWSYTSAAYVVRVDGCADYWCATIKDRESGRMVEFLDRTALGFNFTTRELLAAAVRDYIADHPVPQVPA